MKLKSFYKQMDEWTRLKTPYLFILDFEKQYPIIEQLSDLESANSKIKYSFPHCSNENNVTNNPTSLAQFKIEKFPYSFDSYQSKFNKAQALFIEKNVEVINLTTPTPIKLATSLDAIFNSAKAKYKVLLQDKFVCCTPEIFVRIDENKMISTYPMKGTIDANIPDAAHLILNNPKEEREHLATVELLKRELGHVAENVSVPRFRYIDRLTTSNKNLLQVSSEVSGKLKKEYQNAFGKLFEFLLPAGSIVGTPKKEALEIIKEVEGYTRGYYTGVCGVYDGKTLDSCVLIRLIEKEGEDYYYKSGGGITSESIALNEYEEIKDKIYVPLD